MTLPTVRLLVFVLAYVALAFPMLLRVRVSRAAIAAAGAAAMLLVGRLSPRAAYAAIDGDVLVFLFGVLVVAGYLERAGVFEWVAGTLLGRVTDTPHRLLAVLIGAAGLTSALCMNDTICLVLTPLVLATIRPLRLPPTPYLLGVALAANVGSAMAITGNPQNMIIGLASHIGFAAFLAALALPALGGLVIVYGVLAWLFRRELSGVLALPPPAAPPVLDRRLAATVVVVFSGMLLGWVVGAPLALVSLVGAAAISLLGGRNPMPVLARLDWSLLVFFAGLFVIVGGVRDVAFVQQGTAAAVHALNGTPLRDATVVSGAMLVLSNLVSNVPAVLLWRHVVPALPDARFLWLVLAMSSTFAGNFTLLGSLASLIVAERARAAGAELTFGDFLKAGIPVTLLTMAWGIGALVLTAGR
jgi:Na+/H+ antiporter NhaD/arsenite permease-like protein